MGLSPSLLLGAQLRGKKHSVDDVRGARAHGGRRENGRVVARPDNGAVLDRELLQVVLEDGGGGVDVFPEQGLGIRVESRQSRGEGLNVWME